MAACQSPKDQIVRKWQIDSFESPYRDSMMKVQEHSIDTITVVDSGMAMFAGTFNADSFKTIIKKQMKDQKEEQDKMAKQITMNFQKDGIMIQEGSGRTDSLKYTMPDEKTLELSMMNPPAGMPNKPEKLMIEKISSSEMRLKAGKDNQIVYINLKAAK